MKEFSDIHMQQFDGAQSKLSRSEMHAAADIFTGGVRQLLEKHTTYVDLFKSISGETHRVELEMPLEDGSVEFKVEKTTGPQISDSAEISIKVRNEEGRMLPLTHKYYTDNTGDVPQVLREDKDFGVLLVGSNLDTEAQIDPVTGETVQRFVDPNIHSVMLERLLVYERNRALGKDMGTNDQPVSSDEVRSVLEVVEQAEPLFYSGQDLQTLITTRARVANRMPPYAEKTAVKGAEAFGRYIDNFLGDNTVFEEVDSADDHLWIVRVEKKRDTVGEVNHSLICRWTEIPDDIHMGRTTEISLRTQEGKLYGTIERDSTTAQETGLVNLQDVPMSNLEAGNVRNFLRTRTWE